MFESGQDHKVISRISSFTRDQKPKNERGKKVSFEFLNQNENKKNEAKHPIQLSTNLIL